MTSLKIYLNVPYAEKDAAKALGARWDAAVKKWYAPNANDLALFAKWVSESANQDSALLTTPAKQPAKANKTTAETVTRPSIPDFVAYDGELPPWD
jgi:hypothetical protein